MKTPVTRYTARFLIASFAVLAACAQTKPAAPPPGAIPPQPAPVLVEPPRPELKPEPVPPPPPPEPQQTELYRLLAQSEGVRKMAAADAAKELEQARQSFARSKTDYNRLFYALLLLLPSTGGPDEARAGALLEPIAKDKGGANGMRAFAAFVYYQLAENRKLEERMREEQKRADSLQEKLDALKEVEKSLIDREQASPNKR